MNRNQIFTTVEFVDDLIRMTVGEYYNEKFYIFDTFKCQCSGLEASNVINEEEVRKTFLNLISAIKDKTDIDVEEIILCMPSNHLIISDFASTSPVTGTNSLINQYDINESYKTASKFRHQDNEIVINVCPIEYQLDDNQKMDIPPLRYKSSTFKTSFKVYMLPENVYNSYLNVIESCGIKISKYYLDVDCLYSGIFEEDDISSSILNMDRFTTSLLLYKKGKLLDKITIPVGTQIIEKEVEESLQIIGKNEIRNCIYNIGSCLPSANSYLNVCKNREGKYISEDKLNSIIEKNIKTLISGVFSKVSGRVDISDLDVYVVGYGANVNGVETLIKRMYNCNAMPFISNSLGLYNTGYCQTIGLIKTNYKKISQNKYINLQNKDYSGIIVSKETSSKFDRFILNEDELE